MKTIALLFLCSLAETATSALIIDDFSRGGVTLDTVNGVGRDSRVEEFFPNPSPDFPNLTRSIEAEYSTQVQVDTSAESFNFNTRNPATSNGHGYFELFWTFDSPTNLLNANDSAFLISVLELNALGPSEPRLSVNNSQYRGPNELTTGNTGLLEFAFDDFEGVDFSAIESIRFSASRQPVGSNFVIGSISVIPEPSTAGLLGLAMFALLKRRRNS